MPPFNVVLQILSAILTGYVAVLIFRHHRNGPERRRELTVLGGALAATIFAIVTPVVTWLDGRRAEAESRSQFVQQVSRLDTIVDRTALLSQSAHALADSLGWSLGEQRRQSTQQDQVLTGLRAGAERQSSQIRDQQELLRAQEALNTKTLRQSFPLETPIGVYGELEYPADSVGIGAFVDSVAAWSRAALQRTPRSQLARYPDRNGVVRGEIPGLAQGDRIWYRLEGARAVVEMIQLYPASATIQSWRDDATRWFLMSGSVAVTIANRRADPPLEFRLVTAPDTTLGIYQLDRNLSPTSPYFVTLDPARRTVALNFADRSADLTFRTGTLSVLDLPCSTVTLRPEGTRYREFARIRLAELFFGYSESQWQLRIPTETLVSAGPESWQTTLGPNDIFQSAWSADGWTRYGGLAEFLETHAAGCSGGTRSAGDTPLPRQRRTPHEDEDFQPAPPPPADTARR